MRTCQFCGATVEYVELAAAEESQQVEPPSEEVASGRGTAVEPAKAAMPRAQNGRSAKTSAKKKRGLLSAPVVAGLVLGGFVLLVAVVLLHFSQQGQGNGSITIGTPQESNAAAISGAASAGDLGVDVYPGARALSPEDHSDSSDKSVVSASFVSSAEMDQVINFYKTRMVGYTSIYASGDGVVVSTTPSPQETVLIAISPAQSGGKTKISITHTTTKSGH